MKKIIILVILVALFAGGIFLYLRFRSVQQAQSSAMQIEMAVLETGDLKATIGAIGKVRSSQSATLNWSASGTVEKVNYKVGDKVNAGDILASLERTSLPQNVINAEADLASAQQALEELKVAAETSKVKAMQEIVTYEQAVRDAQYQLDNFTVPANQVGLDPLEAVKLMKQRLDEARAAFEPYKFRSSNDPVRQQLKEALDQAQADYNAAVRRLQYVYDLEVAQANLNKAYQDYEKWKNGPTNADLKSAEAKIAAAEATLTQQWIEAPFAGTITIAEPLVGDQVSSASTAFRVDDLSTLFVDLEVSEIDIQQVKVGQEVNITFDALQDKYYQGKVVEVSMISLTTSSVVNFSVTVSVENADENVRPGMTAEVEIITGFKTGVLLIPNQAIQTLDGKEVVYVIKPGSGMVAVEVTLGLASEDYTELLGGELKAGDQIVLNPGGVSTALGQGGPRMFFGGPMRQEERQDDSGGAP